MAKIEAKEVLESIEKHKKSNREIPVKGSEALAFARGYDLALEHIREIVKVLNYGAEAIEALEKIMEGE